MHREAAAVKGSFTSPQRIKEDLMYRSTENSQLALEFYFTCKSINRSINGCAKIVPDSTKLHLYNKRSKIKISRGGGGGGRACPQTPL